MATALRFFVGEGILRSQGFDPRTLLFPNRDTTTGICNGPIKKRVEFLKVRIVSGIYGCVMQTPEKLAD